jgi:hypothetical protein
MGFQRRLNQEAVHTGALTSCRLVLVGSMQQQLVSLVVKLGVLQSIAEHPPRRGNLDRMCTSKNALRMLGDDGPVEVGDS